MVEYSRRRLRGAMHVHSAHSYDGVYSIRQLAHLFGERGFDFILLAEHSDGLTEADWERIVEESRCLDSGLPLVVPGIEYRCDDGVHLLAMGLERWVEPGGLPELLDRLEAQDCLRVLAHPAPRHLRTMVPYLHRLHGAEQWNIGKDSRIVPRPSRLETFVRLQRHHPPLLGFVGLDFHRGNPPRVYVEVEEMGLDRASVVAALREGRFRATNRLVRLFPQRAPDEDFYSVLRASRQLVTAVRRFRDGGGRRRVDWGRGRLEGEEDA